MSKLNDGEHIILFARTLTRYLATQYDVDDLNITFGKGFDSYCRCLGNDKWRIHYGSEALADYFHCSYQDYVKCQWIWQQNTSNLNDGLEGIHHLVLHEFAHVLDMRECFRTYHTYSRYHGKRRILHGKAFQQYLEELAIICPFEDVRFMS